MFEIRGAIARQRAFPGTPEQCRELFLDLQRLLADLPSVHSVERHADVFRIFMKPVGALGHHFWLATDVRLVDHGQGRITGESLPFDPADPWIGSGVLLYRYHSETRLQEGTVAGETLVDHKVEAQVWIPTPGLFGLLPRSLVQRVADNLMAHRLVQILDEMDVVARRLLRSGVAPDAHPPQ